MTDEMTEQMAGRADQTDPCPHCGSSLVSEANAGDDALEVRMPCVNPDCPGKWTATEFGGDDGLRPSYDVPGLTEGSKD